VAGGAAAPAQPFLAAWLAANLQRPVCVVCADVKRQEEFHHDLQFWNQRALFVPDLELAAAGVGNPDPEMAAARLAALRELDTDPPLSKSEKHQLDIVIDRLVVRPDARPRLMEAIEAALHWNEREVQFIATTDGNDTLHSFTTAYTNPKTGYSLEKLTPQHFSFNTHLGACPACEGVGSILRPDSALIVPDESKSLAEGAIKSWWAKIPKLKIIFNRGIEALAEPDIRDAFAIANRTMAASARQRYGVMQGLKANDPSLRPPAWRLPRPTTSRRPKARRPISLRRTPRPARSMRPG
jgi:hypothetical protein